MNVYIWRTVWGEGKERLLRVKRMEVRFIYTYEDSIMKHTKHCLKEGEETGDENISEGVNLLKILHTHVLNIPIKCSHAINVQ
jgi:hypothetical protein